MNQAPHSLWMVDVIKATASQLIVWHHFISYGPLARTLRPHATALFDWLYHDARMAVQAFLVVGGFLAARSLSPCPGKLTFEPSRKSILHLAWRRYVRLLRPYMVTLLLAIVFAAFARSLLHDPDTPAAASIEQVLFHILLIQDIAGVDALSTGVWYVAIDLQLYLLLLLMFWLSHRLPIALQMKMPSLGLLLLIGLSWLSLIWFNRKELLDIWAIYFVGAYALGIFVQWAYKDESAHLWLVFLLMIYALSLWLEWRSRLVVSLMTASLLWLGLHSQLKPGGSIDKVIAWLSRISYSVFLIHYPIVLLIGITVALHWPDDLVMAVVGYLTAWLITLGLAHALYQYVERP